jgi:hypothetical protein
MGLLLATVASGAPRGTEPSAFTRYQAIIDRAPFGTVGAIGAVAPPGFAARFAFVGVVTTVDTNRALAMIQDRQSNRTHFKAEGEDVDGIKVLRIERKPAKLVMQQGLEQATLTYEQRPSAPAPPNGGVAWQPGGVPMPNAPSASLPASPRRIPFRRGGS